MQVDLHIIVVAGTFFITVGTLIWRLAVLHQRCIGNETSIARAHNRISKLEEIQSHKIEELTRELQIIKESQVRMEERIEQLLSLEKIKTKTQRRKT